MPVVALPRALIVLLSVWVAIGVVAGAFDKLEKAPDFPPPRSPSVHYSRIGSMNVLRQAARASIMRYVRDKPGASVRDLADAAHLNRKTVEYHLRRLLDAGLLREGRVGGVRRYIAIGSAEIDFASLRLLQPTQARIIASVPSAGQIHVRDLARATGLNPGSTSRCVTELVTMGVLREAREAGRRYVSIQEEKVGGLEGAA